MTPHPPQCAHWGTFPSRGRLWAAGGGGPYGENRRQPLRLLSRVRSTADTSPCTGEVFSGRAMLVPTAGNSLSHGGRPPRQLPQGGSNDDTSSVIRLAGDGGCHLLLKEKALGGEVLCGRAMLVPTAWGTPSVTAAGRRDSSPGGGAKMTPHPSSDLRETADATFSSRRRLWAGAAGRTGK